MGDHDDTTVWERVRRPRSALPTGIEKDRRAAPPANYLPYIVFGFTLVSTIVTSAMGYATLTNRVETLQTDGGKYERRIERMEARMTRDLDKMAEAQAAMWRRINSQ